MFISHFFSFIFIPSFPHRWVAGIATLGSLKIRHNFQQSLIVLLTPHQDGTKQGQRCSDAIWNPGPWSTSGSLSLVCSQQNLPRQYFLGHSEHMAEPTQLGPLDSEHKWLDIRGFTNFTSAHFVAKCYTVNSSQKSHLCRLHLG